MTEEMENLSLPGKDQISAAQELYYNKIMEYWRLEDRIMKKLKMWDMDIARQAVTLIKATLINTFYGAGCPNVDIMTEWMVSEKPSLFERYRNIANLEKEKHEKAFIDLVMRIARFKSGQSKGGNAQVFASKFAHFFIDEEDFPIYDQYASTMVNFHVNETSAGVSASEMYKTFYRRFFRLKSYLEKRDSPRCYSTNELDHYLWLSGQYVTLHCWDLSKPPQLYYATEKLFKSDSPYLKQLFPQSLLDSFKEKQLIHELPKWKDANRRIKQQNIQQLRKEKEQRDRDQKMKEADDEHNG